MGAPSAVGERERMFACAELKGRVLECWAEQKRCPPIAPLDAVECSLASWLGQEFWKSTICARPTGASLCLPCVITHVPLSLNPAFVPGRCRSRPCNAATHPLPAHATKFFCARGFAAHPSSSSPRPPKPSVLPLDLPASGAPSHPPRPNLAPSARGSVPRAKSAGAVCVASRFTPERAAPRRDARRGFG